MKTNETTTRNSVAGIHVEVRGKLRCHNPTMPINTNTIARQAQRSRLCVFAVGSTRTGLSACKLMKLRNNDWGK